MAKNKSAQVAHHPSIRSQSGDKRRKVDAISRQDIIDDDDDHHLQDEDEDKDDNGLGLSTTTTREQENSTTNTGIKIDQLGFEILDIIFSFFSTNIGGRGFGGGTSNNSNNNSIAVASSNRQQQQQQDAGTLSHYENQLNLLNFCMVSRGFYIVARLHLSRFIPIASTFKARQVLSLCSSSASSSSLLSSTTSAIISTSSKVSTAADDTFGSRVHSLLLHWPDQGKYSTRRSSVITHDEFILLLSSFPSLRALELVHLPYTSLEIPSPSSSLSSSSLNYATLASMGVLDNLRSLNLNGSPYNLRNEEFDIVIELLSLFKRLENLELLNVPLNSVIKLTELLPSPPSFTLKSLSIKISSPRRIDSNILKWILENTIKHKSCTCLTVWLSKKCTDLYREFNPAIKSVKEDEGFKNLQIPLSKLSPSLRYLSLLGLRNGQSQAILENTSNRLLERLTLFDTFGFGDNILDYLPNDNGLLELEMVANPSIAFGKMPTTLEELAPSTINNSNRRNNNTGNTARNSMASTSTNTNGNGQSSMDAQGSTSASTGSATSASTPSAPGSASASVSASATTTNPADSAAAATTSTTTEGITTTTNTSTTTNNNSNAHPTSFIEIPISSHSFISELGHQNKLSNLKVVRIPENARFARRGRWLNKELIKACRRAGVEIEEIPAATYAA